MLRPVTGARPLSLGRKPCALLGLVDLGTQGDIGPTRQGAHACVRRGWRPSDGTRTLVCGLSRRSKTSTRSFSRISSTCPMSPLSGPPSTRTLWPISRAAIGRRTTPPTARAFSAGDHRAVQGDWSVVVARQGPHAERRQDRPPVLARRVVGHEDVRGKQRPPYAQHLASVANVLGHHRAIDGVALPFEMAQGQRFSVRVGVYHNPV